MRGSLTSPLLDANSPLRDRFVAVRSQSEQLAEPLSPEDQTIQSMPDVSPTKWHLAHTSWFFETFLLKPFARGYRVFDESYEVLFNSYYNSVGQQFPRARRGLLSRPSVSEVGDYRRHVDAAMVALLESSDSAELTRLTTLGLHHEQQHQELLLTDIKHVLSQHPLGSTYRRGAEAKEAKQSNDSTLGFVGFEGGTVELGFSAEPGLGDDDFHYDNEGPRHRALVADFELATRPINNGEVIEFVQAGGYEEPLLWLSDGWAFRATNNLTLPLYWERDENEFSHFTLHGKLPVDPTETACHLTYFEADAIARFMNARLPTEQEWECAAARMTTTMPPFDSTRIRPGRADSARAAGELKQLLGGVWEWTQSPYIAYPGYVAPEGAVGEYNGKFMHNQMVLRGGSCATPDGHIRTTYRNFFPSSAQWQFSGARLARGNNTP